MSKRTKNTNKDFDAVIQDETLDDEYIRFNSISELEAYNKNLVDVNIRLIGDRTVIGEVVQLLAYIRHGIRNGMKTDIKVSLGNIVSNPELMLEVNGLQVPDLTLKNEVSIN